MTGPEVLLSPTSSLTLPEPAAAPSPGGRTYYREKKRTPEEREITALVRELERMAPLYPRFRYRLNQLKHYAKQQMRSDGDKRAAVILALKSTPILNLEEICDDATLDRQNAKATVEALVAEGVLAVRDRNGNAPDERRHPGRWTPYYLLLPQAKPLSDGDV